ncbi:hypothetical protein ABK040_011071 [Willaertia magna]
MYKELVSLCCCFVFLLLIVNNVKSVSNNWNYANADSYHSRLSSYSKSHLDYSIELPYSFIEQASFNIDAVNGRFFVMGDTRNGDVLVYIDITNGKVNGTSKPDPDFKSTKKAAGGYVPTVVDNYGNYYIVRAAKVAGFAQNAVIKYSPDFNYQIVANTSSLFFSMAVVSDYNRLIVCSDTSAIALDLNNYKTIWNNTNIPLLEYCASLTRFEQQPYLISLSHTPFNIDILTGKFLTPFFTGATGDHVVTLKDYLVVIYKEDQSFSVMFTAIDKKDYKKLSPKFELHLGEKSSNMIGIPGTNTFVVLYESWIYSLSVSNNGNQMLITTNWKTTAGDLCVSLISLDSKGNIVAVCKYPKIVTVIDSTNGNVLKTKTPNTEYISADSYFVTARNGKVYLLSNDKKYGSATLEAIDMTY